jgi:formylglycine-generating enzyme required for sulfatase activity
VATTSVRIALPGASTKEQVAAIEQTKKEKPETPSASIDPAPEVEESEIKEAAQPPEPAEEAPDIEPLSGEYRLLTTSNLRAGPSSRYDRIATLDRGTRVTMAGRVTDSDWFQVLTGEGKKGYIFGDLIERVEGEAAEQVAARSLTDEGSATQSDSSIQVAVGIFEEGSTFKDCEFCPSLVRIRPGSFLMGSKSGHSSERPQHRVEIAIAFAIGVFEVTIAEWNACVLGGDCRYRPELDQDTSGSRPVFNVSWEDAQEFIEWLKNETGKEYRLPFETEWEYAARAGTQTLYWWGDKVGESKASCKGCGGDWSRDQPPAVGSYGPNPFGIHDMNGSVAEWVADCWNRSYQGNPPKKAKAWTEGDCTRRVLRGGSWRNDPSYLTSASRFMYDATVRYIANGFRVARSLD